MSDATNPRRQEAPAPTEKVDPRATSAAQTPDEGVTAALQAENASLQDRLLRSLAEAENTRRRSERTAHEARQYAISDFARELLAVADNLHRAIAAAESNASDSDQSLIDGIRATERMLADSLARFNVKKVQALGERFDPARHEAMMQVEDPSQPRGTIIQVLQDGYAIHDRLLRPARVVVAQGPQAPPNQ
jgi:molecular chaperone GrpE